MQHRHAPESTTKIYLKSLYRNVQADKSKEDPLPPSTTFNLE